MPVRAASLVPLFCVLLATPAAAIVCGETVSGTISTLGESDEYPLQLAAGDVVSVSVSPWVGFNFAPIVILATPAQQPLLLDGASTCGPGSVCRSAPAPVSGSYTLRVGGNNFGPTATYSVTIEVLSGSWNGASNAPPTPACGAVADGMRPIGCSETISGAIDTISDSDTYSFVASTGDRIGINGNASLRLFAPGGAPVGFEGGNPSCVSPCASDPLPATGVYTIRVVSSVLGPFSTPVLAPYSFTLESLRESFAGGSRALLCDTTPLACNEAPLAGAIDQPYDSDIFTFFAQAGEGPWVFGGGERFAPDGSRIPATGIALPATGVYTVRVNGGAATGAYELSLVGAQLGGVVCPRFSELSCGGTASGSIPSGGSYVFHSFTARAGDAASLVFRKEPPLAPVSGGVIGPNGTGFGSGTHIVYFGGPAVSQAVSYWLSLESLSGTWNGGSNTAPTPICGAPADGTSVIGCGQTRAGSIGAAGDRDTYTFLAEAGDSVSVQVSPNGVVPSSFWVEPVLYGPNGAPVPGCGFGCMVGSLPATGAYTVLVAAQAPLATGNYTVTLTRTPCASDCNDGTDNDGDLLVDGADGGCTSSDDLSEAPECSDGRDNDGDGAFDFSGSDLGCASPLGASEDPACDDGYDNDRDGATDADGGGTGIVDATCQGVASNQVEVIAVGGGGGCGLGPELVLLLPLLAALRRRAF